MKRSDKYDKNEDKNYEEDYNQMKSKNIDNINNGYWLVSRYVDSVQLDTYFGVRFVNSNGSLNDVRMDMRFMIGISQTGNTDGRSVSNGLRPVFTLKSNIKITGGNGSKSNPYELGV